MTEVGEFLVRLRIDGDPVPVAQVYGHGWREAMCLEDALGQVLQAWRDRESSRYARLWLDADDFTDAVGRDTAVMVRRPERRVHLLGPGRLADQLRALLRRGVDGWRLHDLPAAQTPLQEAEPALGPRVFAMLDRYGFATVEEVAAVPDLELLDVRLFGPKARLAVDAALAAHRSVDDPAVAAARERRRDHIRRRLAAVHQARNAAFLELPAASDIPPVDLDIIELVPTSCSQVGRP